MCGVPVPFYSSFHQNKCVDFVVLISHKLKSSRFITKETNKQTNERTEWQSSGILQTCSIVSVAMLLNQQTDSQESIVISHLKSSAYRNKSLSNWTLTLDIKREKACLVSPYLLFTSVAWKYIYLVSSIDYLLWKVKVSLLQAMKAHGGCGFKGPHVRGHGTGKRQGG